MMQYLQRIQNIRNLTLFASAFLSIACGDGAHIGSMGGAVATQSGSSSESGASSGITSSGDGATVSTSGTEVETADAASSGTPTRSGPGAASGYGMSQSGAGEPTSDAGGPTLSLPIEVLGNGDPDEPVVASVSLPLSGGALTSVQSLYVQCHRCGFYGPPEFEALAKPLATVKASLRIDGGGSDGGAGAPWIDITDANVQVDPVSHAHGGINGGLFTVTFNVPIDAATRSRLVPGMNTIEFRFNGTDGASSGYRILDLQFQDANGNNLSPVTKTWADISAQKAAGKNASSSLVSQGQALWTGRNSLIKSTIVTRTIRAACSDCHAVDGRDLQYFNYSDNSIVQRSRFHGLTQAQGQAIDAFLR
jgi:hypothetical protein